MRIKIMFRFKFLMGGVVALLFLACQSKQEKTRHIRQENNVALMSEKEITNFLSRDQLLKKLKSEQFDILVIGGGATGSGALLDAASRGLKAALIEAHDYSSGTSSRSTKLVHGGVRYLENAVKHLDKQEYDLVRDALSERKRFLENAPHLTNPLPILTPVYGWFQAIYFWIGLKLYDFISGDATLGPSQFLSKKRALLSFPIMKKEGLKGAVVYYDGQFDDARMNVTLILSGLREGGVALNYVRAEKLLKENDKIVGAIVRDMETQDSFPVYAKIIINATGTFADVIRKLDDSSAEDIMIPSQGSHVILPEGFCPEKNGLIIPETKDGRVVFLLPWLGKTLAGTTDHKEHITEFPRATNDEVEYILEYVRMYIDKPLKRSDVIATFSGLRPLARPTAEGKSTASISRDHHISISPSNLITIVGGKWTTYRKMGEDVINTAISVGDFKNTGESQTKDLRLVGASFFKDSLAEELVTYEKLDPDIAAHLVKSYGDRVDAVIGVDNKSRRKRFVPDYPHIEAEAIYAITHEYAMHATDVIARRMRLAFLDNRAARVALPKIVELMGEKLGWNQQRMEQELRLGEEFLDTMFTKPDAAYQP